LALRPARRVAPVFGRVLPVLKPELDPLRVGALRVSARQPTAKTLGSRRQSKAEGGLGSGESTLFLR